MATKTEQAGPSHSGNNPDNTGGSPLRHQSTTPPPPRQSPDPGDETLNLTEEFPLEPLEDLAGAIDQDDIDKSAPILTQDLDLPTLRSVAKIGNNRQIKSRRNEALLKGLKTIGKNHLLSAGLATRRLFMAVFPDELELLDNLFSHVQTRKTRGYMGTLGYRLVIDDYQVLLRILFTRKLAAEDSFRIAGKTPPPLPSWGSDDDLEEYYSPNDFEILAEAEIYHRICLLDLLGISGVEVHHPLGLMPSFLAVKAHQIPRMMIRARAMMMETATDVDDGMYQKDAPEILVVIRILVTLTLVMALTTTSMTDLIL
ncbi:hypothetical protein C8R44DRAFT_871413 [Mycena epipterygia]|nr:hypothetical protein C8R44DRAFT_871413 [Mycena epipterygia]